MFSTHFRDTIKSYRASAAGITLKTLIEWSVGFLPVVTRTPIDPSGSLPELQ